MACTACHDGTITIDGKEKACRGCEVRDAEILSYLHLLAGQMGLEGWVFEVVKEPCGSDNLAEIDTVYGQRYAKVSISRDWDNLGAREQHDTLVHELLHVHLAPLTEMVYDLVDTLARRKSDAKIAKSALYYAEERVVDQIAVAWARHIKNSMKENNE